MVMSHITLGVVLALPRLGSQLAAGSGTLYRASAWCSIAYPVLQPVPRQYRSSVYRVSTSNNSQRSYLFGPIPVPSNTKIPYAILARYLVSGKLPPGFYQLGYVLQPQPHTALPCRRNENQWRYCFWQSFCNFIALL